MPYPDSQASPWTRTVVLLSIAFLMKSGSAVAQLTPPDDVDFEQISATEDYRSFVDNNPASDDYYQPYKAFLDLLAIDRIGNWGIGYPQGYDHGYELLEFIEPDFNGEVRGIYYWDCQDDGCDSGFATNERIIMPAPFYGGASNGCTRMVLGHELFHHVQNTYKRQGAHSYYNWVFEGMARAMQDKIYHDIDTEPDLSCVAGYLEAVEDYLRGSNGGAPIQETSIWNAGYDAALWWTYLMEQYGGVTDANPIYTLEPVVGSDFIRVWYETAVANGETGNSLDTTNDTIQSFDPGTDIYQTFQRFSLANLLKDMDLSANSEGFRRVYSYLDEQPNGTLPQDQYAEVVFKDNLSVSNAQPVDSVVFSVMGLATKYYDIDISQCEPGRRVTVAIDSDFPIPELVSPKGLWGVVVGQSSDGSGDIGTLSLGKFKRVFAEDYATAFFQPANPYDRAFVTVSGPWLPVAGIIEVSCGPAETIGPDIPLATTLNPITPGHPDQTGLAEICVAPANPTPALDPTDYQVAVDGAPVPIVAGTPRDDGHCLTVEVPPSQNTLQDLTVTLGGQSTTVADAIARADTAPNVLIAVNTSSTMLLPPDEPVLDDVKAMLGDFVRQLLPTAATKSPPKIGLIEAASDGVEPNMDAELVQPLVAADSAGLAAFDSAVAALSSGPGRGNAIGDAIQVAMDEFAARGDPDQRKHLVMFADGPETEGEFWANLRDTVQQAGYVMHIIVVGSNSDHPLGYEIARSTGGRFAYVPVSPTAADHVVMAAELAALAAAITGRQRMVGHTVAITDTPVDFTFAVPPQAVGLLLPAVQAARESAQTSATVIGELELTPPEGEPLKVTFTDLLITSYSVSGSGQAELPAGIWNVRFTPQPGQSGELLLGLVVERNVPLMVMPAFGDIETRRSRRGQEGIAVGQPKTINAVFYDGCAATSACEAAVPDQPLITGRLPNSQPFALVPERLEAGPPPMAGGKQAAVHYRAILTNPQGAAPGNENELGLGAYHIQVEIEGAYDGYTVRYLASDSYAVDATIRLTDTDRDGLTDDYENRAECLDPAVEDATLDPDDDGLASIAEFDLATNPCSADTDGGGEQDGSEVAAGRDPLLRADDLLPGIPFLVVDEEITHAERDSPLPPASITLVFGNSPAYSNIVLERGFTSEPRLFDTTFDIDAPSRDGSFVDTSVVPGTGYCYRMKAFDQQGNAARPSEIVCTTARDDPGLAFGDMRINGGNPRTENPELVLDTALYNKNSASSEMLVSVEGFSSGWIPHASPYRVSVSSAAEPRRVVASVRYRYDGAESPTYLDSIELWPAGSLGAITGRVVREGAQQGGEPGLAGVTIYVDQAAEPLAVTDESGQYWFENLRPGEYTLNAGDLDWSALSGFATGTVNAGGTTDVGDTLLPLGPALIFASGFEAGE